VDKCHRRLRGEHLPNMSESMKAEGWERGGVLGEDGDSSKVLV